MRGLIRRLLRRPHPAAWQGAAMENAPSQRELRRLLANANTVLDLGCGPNPIEGATAAVDMHLDPLQRGNRQVINPAALAERGVRFINQSMDAPLPFADDEFDFVYSSHAIEHVEHPGAACDEMMRVGKSGLLRCPAAQAEFTFGRDYHLWLVLQRGGTVLFMEKTADEYAVFGDHRAIDADNVNPFEALLDWGGQWPSTGCNRVTRRLRRRVQELFYHRAPLNEVNLFWREGFRWVEARRDGSVRVGGRAGRQYAFDAAGARHDFTTTEEP